MPSRGRRGARRRHIPCVRPEPRQVPAPGCGRRATVVEVPNAYAGLSLERRTVVLKIHGGIDMRARARTGELRRERGRPHRPSRAGRDLRRVPGHGRRAAATEPFPVPRLPAPGVEPACLPAPRLGPDRVGYRSWAVGRGSPRSSRSSGASAGSRASTCPLDEYLAELEGRRRRGARPVERRRVSLALQGAHAVRGLRARRPASSSAASGSAN